MRQRRTVVYYGSHGNHCLIDVHFKFVLTFGFKKRKYDPDLPFSATYLCESGFSTVVQLKSKQRNRFDTEHDLRVALSTVTPDFETLIKSKARAQLSH